MDKKSFSEEYNIKQLIGLGIAVYTVFLFFIAAAAIDAVSDCYQYERIYQNAIVTDGVISRIDTQTDSLDNTEYTAYVAYTVDGKKYEDSYFTTIDKDRLPSVGENITIKINPEDHSELLMNVFSPAQLLFSLPLVIAFIIIGGCFLSEYILSIISADTEEKKIKIFIYSITLTQKTEKLIFAYGLAGLLLQLKFSFLLNNTVLVICGIAVSVSLLIMLRNMYLSAMAILKIYNVVECTLYNKSYDTEHFYLYYRDEINNWRRYVSMSAYSVAEYGSSITAVYLGFRQKKPFAVFIDGTLHKVKE